MRQKAAEIKRLIMVTKQTLLKKCDVLKSNVFFVAILLCFFFCSSIYTKTIVVFIHGTVLPGLSLLDVSGVRCDKLDESSRYIQAARRVRNDTRFWEDQAVLGEGLWPIMTISNQEDVTQENGADCQREERFAVYPLTRAFDAMAHWSGYLEGDVSYYAFGHLGLLSQSYRKVQGSKLYKELMCLVRQTREPLRIIICAHSHGGNIALCLAAAEEQFRQGLFVDDLLLFGTPVQIETACCAFKKPFKRVVSFFSASDTIQLSDWLSTKGAASFRTFTVPHKQGKCRYTPPEKSYGQVIDMRCSVNDDTRCISHQNFWYLGRSRRLCSVMDMLPLMVLAPVYATLLRNHVTSHKMLVDGQLSQKSSSSCILRTNALRTNMPDANITFLNLSPAQVLPSRGLQANASLATSVCSSLSCMLVFPGKITQGLTESEAQQFGKLVQLYDRAAKVSWHPTYKHRILLLYREDFMREMLGLFSWLDLKVRMWGYKTFKSVRSWFGCE